MGTNIARMIAVLFSVFVLLNACNDTTDNVDDSKKLADDPERLQVYDEGTPFNGTCVLVGRPVIPDSIRLIEWNPDYIFTPGTSTEGVTVYPWTVGEIDKGKIAIGFTDEKLELGSDFEYSFIEGVRICMVYIEHKDYSSMKFGLHKINPGDYSAVYIYYASADFNRPHNGIALKAGWNFIEELRNPNWVFGSEEPIYIIGSTSQDVNDFLKKGYRWQLEHWN